MRPAKTDYAEYYLKYIEQVKGDDILKVLENNTDCINILRSISDDKADYSYAPGKWTTKQLIEHLTDTERIMSYRALRISRNDTQQLPGFDQDEYVKNGTSKKRKLKDLIDEFEHLRKANLLLFRSFDEKELSRRGKASGFDVTVLALLFIIAGHEIHHCKVLKDKYLD
jgi:uncharacterized damage-inducible protein DinB